MGGIFGVASKTSCVFDLFFGTDYHSHLGTKRGDLPYMVKMDLTEQYIILKILHFVQSLKKM
jgi:hypothetical protein